MKHADALSSPVAAILSFSRESNNLIFESSFVTVGKLHCILQSMRLRSVKNIWLIHRIISFLSSFKHTRFSASLRSSWSIYLMTILIARSWKWLGTCQFPVCVPSGIPYVVMRISWRSALGKRFSARTLERHFEKRLSGIIAVLTRTREAIFIKNANDLRYVTW